MDGHDHGGVARDGRPVAELIEIVGRWRELVGGPLPP
jgi:hypothetical protein